MLSAQIIAILIVAATGNGQDLTRASGLYGAGYNQPPVPPSYPQSNYTTNFDDYHPSRIRIALTRNLTYRDGDRLQAPELSYFGMIGVGTPAKLYNVVFDTGSSETWIPYYNWFPLANNVHYHLGYSTKESSTSANYAREYSFDYRRTKLTGSAYEDQLTLYEDMIKDDADVVITPRIVMRQNFLGISDASNEQFRYKPYDGVVGLAPVAQSGTGTRNPMISFQQEMQRYRSDYSQMDAQQQQQQHYPHYQQQPRQAGYYPNQPQSSAYYPPEQAFSIWLNPNQNSRHGGEIMFGGIDENRFMGDIYYHRLQNHFDWKLPLAHVLVGGQVASCSQGCEAQLDTGANSIVGPRADVYEIYNSISAQHDYESDLWLVDCARIDSYPMLTFKIDDTPYVILPRHYIKLFKHRDSIYCQLALKPWDSPDWLLGTSFIGAYYTVFDFGNRRVGFASPRG